ncbi:MAG TPA: hypothetical protein K8V32_09740 [Enteractinococcus helveticum]|uniref:Uncharacterized protein n=1 Tax=Enteractinococcus helveticum TaxID=1837282 RepID=A0A921K7R8_9MICC|nr:hypothetical protein [Enteractinococcus helveticum]HJF15065.1 hypothetical protein [Enteractinococcus helveticum]
MCGETRLVTETLDEDQWLTARSADETLEPTTTLPEPVLACPGSSQPARHQS